MSRLLPQGTRHERDLSRRMRRRCNTFCRGCNRPTRDRLAMSRGRADFRNHGPAHVRFRRPNGYPLLGRGTYVAADRNDPDVLADECLPFVALAEGDVQPEKLHRPDRAAAFEPSQPTNALRTLAALVCIRAGAAAPPYSVPATCEYDGSSTSRAANPVILFPFGPALAAGRGGQRWPERGTLTRSRRLG
jgi:hypothetical protein